MTRRLPPIASRRLYQQIAAVLRSSIADGSFPVGGLLPPERTLAAQLAVSRASVREALIALEVEGCVSVRVGDGVRVLRRPVPAKVARAEPPVGPLDLLAARLVVECETAALAARRATPADLERLDHALEQMQRDHERGSTRHRGDRLFHAAIARASGNAALEDLVVRLWDLRPSTLQARLEAIMATRERFTAAVADHRAIRKAIRARDARGARDAMRRHLTRVRDSFSRALDADA